MILRLPSNETSIICFKIDSKEEKDIVIKMLFQSVFSEMFLPLNSFFSSCVSLCDTSQPDFFPLPTKKWSYVSPHVTNKHGNKKLRIKCVSGTQHLQNPVVPLSVTFHRDGLNQATARLIGEPANSSLLSCD